MGRARVRKLMATKSHNRWRITIIGTPTTIGYVVASDVETAVKKAIEEFKITNVQMQQRLVAGRIKRSALRGRSLS